jgi:hypothetical protein
MAKPAVGAAKRESTDVSKMDHQRESTTACLEVFMRFATRSPSNSVASPPQSFKGQRRTCIRCTRAVNALCRYHQFTAPDAPAIAAGLRVFSAARTLIPPRKLFAAFNQTRLCVDGPRGRFQSYCVEPCSLFLKISQILAVNPAHAGDRTQVVEKMV